MNVLSFTVSLLPSKILQIIGFLCNLFKRVSFYVFLNATEIGTRIWRKAFHKICQVSISKLSPVVKVFLDRTIGNIILRQVMSKMIVIMKSAYLCSYSSSSSSRMTVEVIPPGDLKHLPTHTQLILLIKLLHVVNFSLKLLFPVSTQQEQKNKGLLLFFHEKCKFLYYLIYKYNKKFKFYHNISYELFQSQKAC